MTCCRYLSIAFRPEFPPTEANAELTKVEMMVRHLSEKSLLVYALLNFQTHLDHLGSNNAKIRHEFMNFVEFLSKRSSSFAHLLLGRWIGALDWPQKLHVDDTSARLCLHILLLCAAEAGNKKAAEVLVSLRPDLLHIEVGKGNLISMKSLHESPPNAISQIIGGWATLRGGDGHEAGLILLLDLGADVNSKDTVGRTPISYAVEKGHKHGLQLLIQHVANVDAKDGAGRTPLSYAAENGHKDILELLLQHGPVGINSNDTAGRTPLSYAAENGHESSVKLLLNNGAYLQLKDTAGRTPLSYAAENRHTISVKVLLQGEGVEFNSEDTSGRTPLSYATANGHTAVVELLQSYATR